MIPNKTIFLLGILISALFFQVIETECNISNALTDLQNQNLKAYTGSTYISSNQETTLRTAYKSLNRKLDNYLLQLQDQFLFDVNDIEICSNIPTYITFKSRDNIYICFISKFMVLKCNKEWELKIGCGTFIQLHRPFDTEVLGKILLQDASVSSAFSMTMINVCAGTYHLWFVYSTRVGKIIKNVKPIFISYPACQCF